MKSSNIFSVMPFLHVCDLTYSTCGRPRLILIVNGEEWKKEVGLLRPHVSREPFRRDITNFCR